MTRNTTHPDDEEIEALIDEALKDTFPASDPPAWTLGTDHSVKTSDSPGDEAEDGGGQRER